MKRFIALLLALTAIVCFSSCSGNPGGAQETHQSHNAANTTAGSTNTDVPSTNSPNTDGNTDSAASEGDETSGGDPAAEASVVYMTTDISPEGLMKVYEALGVELTGDNIAVKLSTGEPPASNYLDPDLIRDLVELVNGTIVE